MVGSAADVDTDTVNEVNSFLKLHRDVNFKVVVVACDTSRKFFSKL
jgi:hypothetical protein